MLMSRAPLVATAVWLLATGCSSSPAANSGALAGSGGQPHSAGGSVGMGGKAPTGGSVASGGSSTGGAQNSGGGASIGGSASSGGSAGAVVSGGAGGVSSNTYNPCPTAGSPCVVLPLGDSITYGYPHGDLAGYRAPLFALAHQAGKSMTYVGMNMDGPAMVDGVVFPKAHEGYGGWTCGQLQNRATETDFQAFAPHIVLLHAGTNDIQQGNMVPSATVAANLSALLDQVILDFPDALVVVAQIIPNTVPSVALETSNYNALIPAVVNQHTALGKHVILVDQFTPFYQDANFATNLMEDDDHPNPAGYALMAQTWYQAIGQLLR
ncbi:MAG: SGNH/GDSL hydrolase family protein [Polyangiaceae bacterium]|nr:SGNH/GDSL hydrolase family protein [Polyangiaceae bacterium]